MKFFIAFVAIAGLITTSVSSQKSRSNRNCSRPGPPPPHAGPPPRPQRDQNDGPAQAPAALNAVVGTVVITGGYETDARDQGRPVALIAAALGVKPQVFRDAFSKVKPSRNGHPTEARATSNKKVLLDTLGKHGVSNERLDEVSNYYRYQPGRGKLWKQTPASATAITQEGKVTGFKITNPGSGYLTPPRVTVAGHPDLRIKATLRFSKDLRTNGSIASLMIQD